MRQTLIDALYQILAELRSNSTSGFYYLSNPIPPNFIKQGIYFFFDETIPRKNGGYKIIRVGISGIRNSRLLYHQRGSMVNSVFRKHVGRALAGLMRGKDNYEPDISSYIHRLPYLFVPISDLPYLKMIEKRCIELLSNKDAAVQIDVPPSSWLGYVTGVGINPKIAKSNLWCVHYVDGYRSEDLSEYLYMLSLLKKYAGSL